MSLFKRVAALATAVALAVPLPAGASAYDAHPKIVVILVIDQFRADYLDRYRADFKGRGFRLFLDRGAYFPDCYYGYANTKTAPGHATIGTGAYTDGHGISSNEWWDLARNAQREVSSVEDERYGIVGLAAASGPDAAGAAVQAPAQAASANATTDQAQTAGPPEAQTASKPPDGGKAPKPKVAVGASPRNLLASTVGDELRLATGGVSQVWGVSLKDRAAILPAGGSANGAFWIDAASGRFVTSTYYMQALPDWAAAFNSSTGIADAETAAGVAQATSFYNQVGRTPSANAYELSFAEALIAGENLGKHPATDLLTVSLSANDILGHQVGPDSPEEHAMVDALDADLDGFFTWLDKNVDGGLGNVWVALTADHGIAPVPAVSASLGLKGAYLDLKALTASLNAEINQKFSPGENQPYLMPQQELPYIALNEPVFARAGINELEAEQAVQGALGPAFRSLSKPEESGKIAEAKLPPVPEVYRSYTRQQLAAGELPPTPFGSLLAHSYSPNGGWYVMVIPVAYQMEGYSGGKGTTHYSPFSYDRHVPLGFYGAPFAAGIYHGQVEPVDLAVTLAALLGVNQPSAAVGHVLTQALKPAALVVYPKEPPPPGTRTKARAGRKRHGGQAADQDTGAQPAAGTQPAAGPAIPAAAPPASPKAPQP